MDNMYTILINEDHSFSHTVKKKIMCRSTGIDSIRFLVNQMYGDLDMKEANVVLEIRTPISKTYKPVVLEASEELYKNRVEFIFPITIEYTKEVGDLELTINFSYLEKDEDGNFTERVRRIGVTSIEIHDTVHWSDYITDSNLDNIAQIMLSQQSLLEEQREIALALADNQEDCATDLVVEDGKLYLVKADGNKKGNGADVVVPRVVDDSDGANDGLIELGDISYDDNTSDDENGNFSEL